METEARNHMASAIQLDHAKTAVVMWTVFGPPQYKESEKSEVCVPPAPVGNDRRHAVPMLLFLLRPHSHSAASPPDYCLGQA